MSETEMTRAAALLEDATDLIKTIAPKWETIEVSTLKRVACQVVKRAMLASDLGEVSSLQEQTGPFMTQVSYSNPQGDLYLTRLEKIQLGLLKNNSAGGMVNTSSQGAHSVWWCRRLWRPCTG